MQSGIQADDHHIAIDRDSLGPRRLKALLLLLRHPELDQDGFKGEVILHFAGHGSVKGAIHPAVEEIAA